MSQAKTVTVKVPGHPCGEVVYNADDPQANVKPETAPVTERKPQQPRKQKAGG